MNENKGIENPRIKIGKYIGAKAQDKTCVETIQKRTMGLIFNIQNSPVIENPRIKIGKYIGAKAQDKTCVETIQKRTMGLIFNIQNSPVIDFVLTDARNLFRYPAKIRLRQISQLSIFVISREKCITKAIEFVTFGFSFRILVSLPFKESLNVTVCKQYGFFSVLTTLD